MADSAEIDQPLGALYSLFASVEASGQAQRSIVRVLDIRFDRPVAARLSLPEFAPLLYLERLRLAGDSPLALDRVWLPAAGCRPLLDADFTHTALYDELSARCGVRLTGGHEHIRAVVVTAAERSLLSMDEGTAAFAIERLGRRAEQPFEWRHTLVRGDRFTVSADFTTGAGYRLEMKADHGHADVEPGARMTAVTPPQAQHLIEAGALLIDVRTIEEFAGGHAPDARHNPLEFLDPAIFVGGPPVLVVSSNGERSEQAAILLRAAGIDALNLSGGMAAWTAAGLAIQTD